MPETRKSPLIPLVVAAIAALALSVALFQGGDDPEQPVPGASPESAGTGAADPWEQLARRAPGDPMALGEPTAPVVMIGYSDFQCTYCGKFARDTEPTLVEKYVEDGTLRIEWRDFPYLGPASTLAARAGRAAAAQDRFWEFEEAMFADQPPPNSGELDEAHLVEVAEEIGLDVARFRDDLSSSDFKDAVQADFVEGQTIGVSGTPAFVVNGVPVIGAQPIEVFERAIEKAAQDAGS